MCELLKINVNDHTERKNGLTYLSWAWAWSEALKIDPAAEWEPVTYPHPDGTFAPCMYVGGGTAMVKVNVTIKGKTRSCVLPVMDHRNKAIKDPDAFAINTAIMRCMTKAISMHGLGLYIYAGEDLPEADEGDGGELEQQLKDSLEAIKGKKIIISATEGAGNGLSDERKQAIQDIALHLIDCHKAGKDVDAIRIWYEPTTFEDNDERVFCWSLLKTESKLRSTIKANRPAEQAA